MSHLLGKISKTSLVWHPFPPPLVRPRVYSVIWAGKFQTGVILVYTRNFSYSYFFITSYRCPDLEEVCDIRNIFSEEGIAEPLSKNTARIQLDGWHLLFKEYLPDYWNIPLYTTSKLSRNTGANEDRHLKCRSIKLSIFSLFEGFFKELF